MIKREKDVKDIMLKITKREINDVEKIKSHKTWVRSNTEQERETDEVKGCLIDENR